MNKQRQDDEQHADDSERGEFPPPVPEQKPARGRLSQKGKAQKMPPPEQDEFGEPPAMFSRERDRSLLPDPEDDDVPEATNSFAQFLRKTATAVDEREDDGSEPILPRQPRTLMEVGLSKAFLTDLALKIIHYSGSPSMTQMMRRLALGSGIVQQLATALAEERLVEIVTEEDLYPGNYRYRLTERGVVRVNQALERSRYAGPAPVTAEQYSDAVRRLHGHKQEHSGSRMKGLLKDLVLSSEVSDSVARALYSGKAALFFGPSGNGKTSILERYAHDLDGLAIVPYAVYAYGQTIRVFDQSFHEPLEDPESGNGAVKEDVKVDRRWVLIRRPAVVVGAEMGPEDLEMAFDPTSRFYQAPPHIKAQGGVLIIDDFGRQRVASHDLLTRLLIPIERGWDTLSLTTGEKLTVPYSAQLLLATNLPVKRLADDALLRRILYKVEIPNPQPAEFAEILRQICRQKRVLVSDGALDQVVHKLYNEPKLKPRASYGRDLIEMIIESASYDGRDPVLDKESFNRVFKLFVAQESEEGEPDY